MEEKLRPKSMKTNAFMAIVLATGAITLCMISFPIVFNYIQTFESQVQTELDLCKVTLFTFSLTLAIITNDLCTVDLFFSLALFIFSFSFVSTATYELFVDFLFLAYFLICYQLFSLLIIILSIINSFVKIFFKILVKIKLLNEIFV